MSPELEENLCKKYPKIFCLKDPIGNGPQLPFTLFMFEVGDGWYNIIDSLCRVIQSEVDQSQNRYDRAVKENAVIDSVQLGETELFEKEYGPLSKRFYAGIYQDFKDGKRQKSKLIEPIPQIIVEQVKEKFGTLRFYTNYSFDNIDAAIYMAELMSACTCEVCGSPGKMNKGGWLSVRCREHTALQDLADYDDVAE